MHCVPMWRSWGASFSARLLTRLHCYMYAERETNVARIQIRSQLQDWPTRRLPVSVMWALLFHSFLLILQFIADAVGSGTNVWVLYLAKALRVLSSHESKKSLNGHLLWGNWRLFFGETASMGWICFRDRGWVRSEGGVRLGLGVALGPRVGLGVAG